MAVQNEIAIPAATAVTTSEAVVAILPALPEVEPNPYGIDLRGEVNYSPSVSGTALTLRVRQGTLVGGALVGNAETTTVANPNSYAVPFGQVFPGGSVMPAANQFCLTAQGTGAGGTINNGSLFAQEVTPAGP